MVSVGHIHSEGTLSRAKPVVVVVDSDRMVHRILENRLGEGAALYPIYDQQSLITLLGLTRGGRKYIRPDMIVCGYNLGENADHPDLNQWIRRTHTNVPIIAFCNRNEKLDMPTDSNVVHIAKSASDSYKSLTNTIQQALKLQEDCPAR